MIDPFIVQTLSAQEFRSPQMKTSKQLRLEDGVSIRSLRMGRRYKAGPSRCDSEVNEIMFKLGSKFI